VTDRNPDLPRQFYRVVWAQGFGWPECERREQTARNFRSITGVGQQLAIIERLPSHHELIGVWQSTLDWQRLDPDSIPRPIVEEDDADDD
jgi:hypothetical protein